MAADRNAQGFNGAASGEAPGSVPPASTPTADQAEQLAEALARAAAAEGQLEQATARRQRLNRDDPAVKAARELVEATERAAEAQRRSGPSPGAGGRSAFDLTPGNAAAVEAFLRGKSSPDSFMGQLKPTGTERVAAAHDAREKAAIAPKRGEGPGAAEQRHAEALKGATRAAKEHGDATRAGTKAAKEHTAAHRGLQAMFQQPDIVPLRTAAAVAQQEQQHASLRTAFGQREVVSLALAGPRLGEAGAAPGYPKEFDTPADMRRRELRDMRDRTEARGNTFGGEHAGELDKLNARHAAKYDAMSKAGTLPAGYDEQVERPTGRQAPRASFGERMDSAKNATLDILSKMERLATFTNAMHDAGTQPFTTDYDRTQRKLETIPLFGELVKGNANAADEKKYGEGGIRELRERMNRESTITHMDLQQELSGPRIALRDRESRAESQRDAIGRIGGTALTPEVTKRESLYEQRKYGETQELLPAMTKYRAAQTDAVAADREAFKIAERRMLLEEKITNLRLRLEKEQGTSKDIEKQLGDPNTFPNGPGNGVSQIDLTKSMHDVAITTRQLSALSEEAIRLRFQQTDAATRSTQAKYGERQAFANLGEVTLEQERRKEVESAGGARRLGMMGPEGRMYGQMAFNVMRQMGPENTPGELMRVAEGFAPVTVGNMAEQAGKKMQGWARGMAPDEPGFQPLDKLRGSVDSMEKGVGKARNEAARQWPEELVDELRRLREDLTKKDERQNISDRAMKAAIDEIKAIQMLLNRK